MLKVESLCVESGAFQIGPVSFTIQSGECLGLKGASGSGKTTLMEAICGLRQVASGKISINQREISESTPAERNIGLVPQENVLFPHMRVAAQISYGLRLRKWSNRNTKQRVEEVAEALQIEHLLTRLPNKLSGGEAKRVAIARAIAFRPDLLCLDESFTGMDEATRQAVMETIGRAIEQDKITTLLISHQPQDLECLASACFDLDTPSGS